MIRYVTDVPNAPKAIGPYSVATVHHGVAYISGQVPIDPSVGKLVDGGIEAQTEQVLKNLAAILAHLGADFSRVMKTVIYLTDLKNFQIVNKIYEQRLGSSRPARVTIEVKGLPLGAAVEIEMTAAVE